MLGNLFGRGAGQTHNSHLTGATGSAVSTGAGVAAPGSLSDFFVGRTALLEAFCRYPNPHNQKRLQVFMVHGAPGLGKSTLLHQLRAQLSALAPDCAQAHFDFAALRDTGQAWRETLCTLRAQLGRQGLHFPRFDLLTGFSIASEGGNPVLEPMLTAPLLDATRLAFNALDVYQNASNELWEFAVEAVQNKETIFPHLESAIVGTDSTSFANQLGELCRRALMNDAGLPSDIVEAFALDLIDFLPPAMMVYPDANSVESNAIRGVLFFDGYEQLWNDRHAGVGRNERQLDWWMRDLCAYCLAGGVLPVIAGRNPLCWAEDDPDWTNEDLEHYSLGRLSFGEARQFLAHCGIGAPAGPGENEWSGATGPGWAEALVPRSPLDTNTPPLPEVPLDPLQAAILQCCAATEHIANGNQSSHTANLSTNGNPEFDFSNNSTVTQNAAVHSNQQIGCHPFWLALCATIVQHSRMAQKRDPNPTQFVRLIGEHLTSDQMEDRLCDWFLRALNNRTLERCLIALSLTPRFDEAGAKIQAEENDFSAKSLDWQLLVSFFFLQAETEESAALQGPQQFWRVHPLMRSALTRRLKHEQAIEEHLKLQHYWAERQENELAWFHQWSIDPTAALALWRSNHRMALEEGDLPKARAQLSLWREIILDESDHQKLGDPLWARTHATIAHALIDTPTSSPTTAFCLAIDHLQNAHHGYIATEYGAQRSEVQNLITQVKNQLILAEAETAMRVGNLERARDGFLEAQEYFTPENFPGTWCQIQTNLALTFREMPDDAATLAMLELKRDTETNATRAIKHFEKSLKLLSRAENPDLWGQSQRSLALLYKLSPGSARIANARKAIAYFEESLKFFTSETHPDIWGQTQRDLADCHMELRGDDREQALRQAISYYDTALKHFTGEHFPLEHAEILHDVGVAWGELGYIADDLKAFEVARSAFDAARTDFQILGHTEEAAKAQEVAEEIAEKLERLRKSKVES